MRDSIDLRLFNVGLVSNPDQEDIPNEAQTEGSTNLDVETAGQLKGIPKQTSYTSYGADGTVHAWIARNNGYWDLVYSNGVATKILSDFYSSGEVSSDTVLTGLSAMPAEVIIPNNQEVHIGMGRDNTSKWVGYISHGQFGGDVPSGIQVEDAEPEQPSASNTVTATAHTTSIDDESVDDEDARFPRGYMYHYKVSFVYDGYQESPLAKPSGTGLEVAGSTVQITANTDYVSLVVSIPSVSSLSKRITGIKVYRREKPFFDSGTYADYQEFLDTVGKLPYHARPQRNSEFKYIQDQIERSIRFSAGSLGDYGEFKLIKDIDINDSGWEPSGAGTTTKTFSFNDNNQSVGSSYYSNTGMFEEEDIDGTQYSLDYGLGTTVNNHLFVTDAAHPKLPDEDAAHMIFRSKPYRYDTFDWVEDKLIMPTIPKAMKAHRGKLYVWDENTTYIINPISFQIEKSITGRGCSSQRSVVNTDYGLFWANKNGVYWNELSENLLKPVQDNLTEPIKDQYQTAVSGETPILVYNSPRNQLLVHVGNDVYAYNTVERRWDYYEDFTLSEEDSNTGAIIGKDGETYTIYEGGIYEDFSSSTREYWSFYSKEFTLDDPSQDKKFYKIISDYSSTVTIEYSTDGGTTWVTASSENLSVVRAKSIKLRISATSATATLDSISILYRRLRGKR